MSVTQLERQRLEHRAGRLEHVISALQDRVVDRQASGTMAPKPLRRAIADFRIELAGVRRRLAEASSEPNEDGDALSGRDQRGGRALHL